MKRIIVVLYLVVLSIVSCEKVDVARPIEPTEYCWTCLVTYDYRFYYTQYEDNKPVYFHEEVTFKVCDMSEENIKILERSSSDSTVWSSGYIQNSVYKVTNCKKE